MIRETLDQDARFVMMDTTSGNGTELQQRSKMSDLAVQTDAGVADATARPVWLRVVRKGDVFTGFGDYDLLGPSAFMSAGQPGRVRSLLEGYGYAVADIDDRLKRRLLALMLLHRASDPNRHICIPDWPSKAANLRELQQLIWPS